MIHYHGVPFSGDEKNQTALAGKHAFISFAHSSHIGLVAEVCQSFALDNGAFSAWKSGKPFDLEGYAEFVDTWRRHPGFDFCVMPDVIDGDHNDNARMRAAWSKFGGTLWKVAAPVYHLHEPLEVIRDFANAFPRVCIGSSGEYSTIGNARWWARMAEVMETICDDGFPRCKLHGLRMLDPTIFSHFPFSSADSTNVARNCGLDTNWNGTYAPATPFGRALVMMERIERHASAARWAHSDGITKNLELFG